MKAPAWLLVALVGLLVVVNSLYIVKETQRAVLLQFGRVQQADIPPGLHAKWPFVNQVRKFDSRILTIDVRPEEFLTAEKKVMMVDSYIKWRVDDVATYYKATNGEVLRIERLIAQRVNEGLRNQFGERSLSEVVSEERDELMNQLMRGFNRSVGEQLGVRVIDVRVKQIELPDDVLDSVYQRMRSEREREAREHRSQGMELAEGIRAAADREKTVIEANAYREAERIRGKGDAQATAIYAAAYQQDPEFYAFVRSLQAYRQTFAQGNDLLLLDPNSDFFRYLDTAGQP